MLVFTGGEIVRTCSSIFLAGPSPRDDKTKSWRPEAVDILYELGYKGNILVPEFDWSKPKPAVFNYDNQVNWEHEALTTATTVLFWVPRDLETLPGFTTNVEFGRFVRPGAYWVYYGRPDESPKNRYLDWMYSTILNKKPANSLRGLLEEIREDRDYDFE